VLSIATDAVMHATGVYPPGQPLSDAGSALAVLALPQTWLGAWLHTRVR